MKYHGHIIKKVPMDLGESDEKLNCAYEIYDKDGNYIEHALTIGMAKDYIDSGYNDNYLNS